MRLLRNHGVPANRPRWGTRRHGAHGAWRFEEEERWASTRAGSTTQSTKPSSNRSSTATATRRSSTSASSRTRSGSASGPSPYGPIPSTTSSGWTHCSSPTGAPRPSSPGRSVSSELWGACQDRPFTMDEFLELSVLISEVEGVRGSLCTDCAMLGRPNVSANWALGHHQSVPGPPALPPGSCPDRRRRHPPDFLAGRPRRAVHAGRP